MSPSLIVQLIVQEGIPAAEKIISLWASKEPANVEAQEWSTLLKTLTYTPDQAIAKAEARLG